MLIGGPRAVNLLHGVAGAAFGPRWAIRAGGPLMVAAVVTVVRVVLELWRHPRRPGPAPSMAAASISDFGIDWRPARKKRKL